MQLTPKQARIRELNIMLRSAALPLNAEGTGTLLDLAGSAGLHVNTLYNCITRGKMAAETAIKLERAIGRPTIRKEVLCPEIFDSPNDEIVG